MRKWFKRRFSRNFSKKTSFLSREKWSKNFLCDFLKEGPKIPGNIISLCLKTNFEILMILYMGSPSYGSINKAVSAFSFTFDRPNDTILFVKTGSPSLGRFMNNEMNYDVILYHEFN